MKHTASGFTLVEILFAAMASALILVAVYGIFQRAVKTRDHAMARMRLALQRERAANIIRNDLRSTYLSGGVLAETLEGGAQSQKSRFPGYLRFTTTTGRDHLDEAYGDVQQVEYYIAETGTSTSATAAAAAAASNPGNASDANSTGTLTRALTRDLLAPMQQAALEEQILTGVQTFEIAFFDGNDWQETWQVTDTEPTLPQAVRVRIQQAAPSDQISTPTPLEILVPLTTEPLTSSTSSTTGTTP